MRALMGSCELTSEAGAVHAFIKEWTELLWSVWSKHFPSDTRIDFTEVKSKVPWEGTMCSVLSVTESPVRLLILRPLFGPDISVSAEDWFWGRLRKLMRIVRKAEKDSSANIRKLA